MSEEGYPISKKLMGYPFSFTEIRRWVEIITNNHIVTGILQKTSS